MNLKNITIITFYDLWIKSFRVINLNLFLGFPFRLTVRGLFRLGIFAINKDWGLFIAFLRLFINLKAKTFVCLWRGVENWWNDIFKFCLKGLRLSWKRRLDKINRLMKKKLSHAFYFELKKLWRVGQFFSEKKRLFFVKLQSLDS